MNVKELFDFITDPTINSENMDRYLEKAEQIALTRSELTNEQLVKDEIFLQVYIPQRLVDVPYFERDLKAAKVGQDSEAVYQVVIGMKPDLSGPQMKPLLLDNESEDEDSIKVKHRNRHSFVKNEEQKAIQHIQQLNLNSEV
ncbi:hypothetical protein CHUAL_002878 [Chamberlinius hualienensis]